MDFWDIKFNLMLKVYNNTEITEAFEYISHSGYNKHIIQLYE